MVVMRQLAIDFSAPPRPRGSLVKGRGPAGPSSIEGMAGRDQPPEVYTRDEVQRLLDGPLGRNAKTRTRNRALLVVMWRAGLRVSEALDLGMEGPAARGGRRLGAAREGREAPACGDGSGVVRGVAALARASGRSRPRSEGPVFCTFTGREVQSSYVRHMCRRLRSKLGLSKRVHAHASRHTHAHELFREGVAEKLIQVQLGHVSLESTDEYLRKIGSNEAVAVVRERGW